MHGGPAEVGAQPQEQFEDVRVGFRADVALAGFPAFAGVADEIGLDGFRGPGLEAPVLVVEKDAAVFDGRRRLHVRRASGGDEQRVVMDGGNVGPPVPGGDADLFGEREGAERRSAAVRADDQQGGLHAGGGFLDGGDEEGLPLAGDGGGIDVPVLDDRIERGRVAERAKVDGVGGDGVTLGVGRMERGFVAGDFFKITGQKVGGDADNRGIGDVVAEIDGGLLGGDEGEGAGLRRFGEDEVRAGGGGGGQKEQGKNQVGAFHQTLQAQRT
jgi:hypothetical protein